MLLGSGLGFWVLGLGARKAQGPDLALGPVKQTFYKTILFGEASKF